MHHVWLLVLQNLGDACVVLLRTPSSLFVSSNKYAAWLFGTRCRLLSIAINLTCNNNEGDKLSLSLQKIRQDRHSNYGPAVAAKGSD